MKIHTCIPKNSLEFLGILDNRFLGTLEKVRCSRSITKIIICFDRQESKHIIILVLLIEHRMFVLITLNVNHLLNTWEST